MDNPDLSLAVYRYLCDVIGTEDVVKKRRLLFTTMDNTFSNFYIAYISSGSKAEGLDLDGSDLDIMRLINLIPVYENEDDLEILPGTVPLVMDTTDCKLGFTQLKYYNLYQTDLSFCEYRNGDWYLSGTRLKEYYLRPDTVIHGPCTSTRDGTFDHAVCVRCSKWILPAKSWISRPRRSRASKLIIDSIVNFGILFVPIGCKNSPNADLEWRISFSYAEKLLIWSFNHVQLLCYALLKVILKDIINETTGDMLCSYFLKTIMLWLCDETETSEWRPDNILSCFMKCLHRLFYCVRYKTCAHYFIPENDLFANRFDKQEHGILLSTFDHLIMIGWTCLLQTKLFKSFRHGLEFGLRNTASYISILPLFDFQLSVTVDGSGIQSLHRSVYFCMRAKKRYFYMYALSVLNKSLAQTGTEGGRRKSGNKYLYTIYRKRVSYLMIGLNHDAVSGWLFLASYFYVNKQYSTCRRILSYCLSKDLTDKILFIRKPSIEEQTLFASKEKYRSTLLSLFRNSFINYVQFLPSSSIRPSEIDILDIEDYLLISPVVFGIFLKFLCNHHLRNDKEKDEALRELEMIVNNRYFLMNDRQIEQAHVLLDFAHSMNDN